MLDSVLSFFLGSVPDSLSDPIAYHLYLVCRYVIGIIFLILVLDFLSLAKYLVTGRR